MELNQDVSLSLHNSGLWLARKAGMDPSSSPYITHYSSFHLIFHFFIPG